MPVKMEPSQVDETYNMTGSDEGKDNASASAAGSKVNEQIFTVQWAVKTVIVVIDYNGDRSFDECYGDEIKDAYDHLHRENEKDLKGWVKGVYPSYESAMIAASYKFIQLVEDNGEDKFEVDDNHDEDKEVKQSRRFKTANGYEWEGVWKHEYGHVMKGSVRVIVSNNDGTAKTGGKKDSTAKSKRTLLEPNNATMKRSKKDDGDNEIIDLTGNNEDVVKDGVSSRHATATGGNKMIEQAFTVKWAATWKIDEINEDSDYFDGCDDWARGAVEKIIRDEVEKEEIRLADVVYASRESAIIAASRKFASLCKDYWKKSEDDPEIDDEDDELDDEEEDVEESEHNDGIVGYPKYTPMMRPSQYKTVDGFEWAGEWDNEDDHQLSGNVKVTVSAHKVLP